MKSNPPHHLALCLLFTGAHLPRCYHHRHRHQQDHQQAPRSATRWSSSTSRPAWEKWPKPPPTPTGKYSPQEPASGPYLVRVTHQAAPTSNAAPQGGRSRRHSCLRRCPGRPGRRHRGRRAQLESDDGCFAVSERYSYTTACPSRGSTKSFQVILPADAIVERRQAQRPTGLPTRSSSIPMVPRPLRVQLFSIQPGTTAKRTRAQSPYHLLLRGREVHLQSAGHHPGIDGWRTAPKEHELQFSVPVRLKRSHLPPNLRRQKCRSGQAPSNSPSPHWSVHAAAGRSAGRVGMPGQDAGSAANGPSSDPEAA